MTKITEQGKTAAVAALWERRAHKPERVNNSSLPAGSPMYYYCVSCGHTAAVLPETHLVRVPKLCSECEALKDLGWLEE